MKKKYLGAIFLSLFLTTACTSDQEIKSKSSASTENQQVTESSVAIDTETQELVIIDSLMNNGFTAKQEPREIDTVVVHYASAIYWFDPSFQKKLTAKEKAYAESIQLTKETLPEHKYDWQLVKVIFETYSVGAHYAIARDGTIVRLIKDNDVAWHAGESVMPTDQRTGANAFSIGIELMASHPKDDPTVKTAEDAYTAEQYDSLQKLISKLCSDHGVTAVVGHDEVAPGRKTDPGPLFQWEKVRNEDYTPLQCGTK